MKRFIFLLIFLLIVPCVHAAVELDTDSDGYIDIGYMPLDQLWTFGAGVTISTGQHLTVGTTQWDDGSDAIDGEQIANDTIDNDSIDWADMTDLTTDGAVVWGNIAEGELANDTVVEADLKAVDPASDEDIFTYESTTGDFEWHTMDEMLANATTTGADDLVEHITGGALPQNSVLAGDIYYVTDDFQAETSHLALADEVPHIDATQTWSAVQTFGDLTLSSLTSAPGSPVGGAWYRADDGTWDPAGLSLGYDYFTIYNDNSTSYIANFDERGTLHFSTLTTTELEFIPVERMDITDGGADPPESLYSTDSNSREVIIATFDGATDENLSFIWRVPDDITGSTIKYRWHGIVTNGTGPSNEAISFQLSCISVADGEQMDFAAYGTTVDLTEAAVTEDQDDLITSAWSSAVTPTGMAGGEVVHCLLNRDADDTDTYAQDFGLIGVDIKYQRTHDTSF